MKGRNTIIVNNEQAIEIFNDWWKKITYSTKSKVTSVEVDDNNNFEVVLDEIIEEEDEGQEQKESNG